MYVCVCNAITERQVQTALDRGSRTLGELLDQLGYATKCGQCTSCLRGQLQTRLQSNSKPDRGTFECKETNRSSSCSTAP